MRELSLVKPLVENLDFQYGGGGVVAVLAKPAKRVFVPARRRTEDYLSVTAQLGANYARMKLKDNLLLDEISTSGFYGARHLDRTVARKRQRNDDQTAAGGRPARRRPALNRE
ncbi:hypothetical protein GQ600_14766 [Phytophthora cactorum]|nr:hypothetical protein GQ600_14766 [Phytophthora cactorum]